MSIMDELKKLTRPYDDDSALIDDDMDLDEGMDEPVYTRPAAAAQTQPTAPVEPPITMGSIGTMGGSPVGTMNDSPRTTMGSMNIGISQDMAKYRVVLVQPEKFDCATAIANHLRQGDAVILNCESTDAAVARRVVDFLSGCAYALDGSIKKAANNVFILVPRDVGVDEDTEKQEDEA
jgi:cell division inhibitor SepF